MKYIVIVPDGMADYPIESLGGRTPLENANTTNMDFITHNGILGLVQTIPSGLPAGSDVGNLSAMGYNPLEHFSGRAPLEAANLGVDLKDNEIAFRCNLVTVDQGQMIDYSAGHIPSEEASKIIDALNKEIQVPEVKFYAGKSYRHLMVVKTRDPKALLNIQCTPPHNILNQEIKDHLPNGAQAQVLLSLMERSKKILENHPINKIRLDLKQNPANMIWLWGQGKKPKLPSFKKKFGIDGSVISAVDLVNGIGKLAGLKVISVPGVNGYYDTNYQGKAQYALDSLKERDFVFIHVEAPDEASHNGDLKMKMACIERIDKEVLGTILNHFHPQDDFRILVLPDHYTPVSKRTHTSEPVCFAMFGKGIPRPEEGFSLNERNAKESSIFFESGKTLMEYFIKRHL
ncbi:MAG: cofactor-independent phosphoglycerate mutase [Candidatus Aceula meridiana]|nr:cofactor-independent phosphoglycerate mutase [Candidatus Aceula meridiana]